MGMLDIFKTNPAFSITSLTDSFNVVPNNFGRLRELNQFPAAGIVGSMAVIERQNQVLNVLPSVPRGGPASKGTSGKREMRAVSVPHFPHEDVVHADDVEGVRRFGSESDLMPLQELVNDKLATMAGKHDITLELLRWYALRGVVHDPVTGDVLLDLFDFMDVTQEVQNWDLDNSGTEVALKINALKRYLELNLLGDTMSGIRVFCGSDFFDALTTHPSIEKAYKEYASAQELLREDVRSGFKHKGVLFEEQNGRAARANGEIVKFVEDDEAIVAVQGSQSFKTYFAPANFIETVNTRGLPRYAKQEVMKWDVGIEIHTQSNPLPVCLRPQLLVKLTKS